MDLSDSFTVKKFALLLIYLFVLLLLQLDCNTTPVCLLFDFEIRRKLDITH